MCVCVNDNKLVVTIVTVGREHRIAISKVSELVVVIAIRNETKQIDT